jgi:VirE N-terminal domain
MTDILKGKYGSKYQLMTSPSGHNVLLIEELQKIKSGYYSHLVNPCREQFKRDRTEYSRLKAQLPVLTFCGLFIGGHKKENLLTYNNIIIIDIDHIPETQIAEIKSKLFSDKYVFACWISPSGNGLKILIKTDTDPLMHKFYFDRILDYLYATYEIQADASGSDICRLCFVSYDKDIWIKDNAEVFPMHEDEWMIKLIAEEKNKIIKKIATSGESSLEIYSQSEKILFFKTEGRNKPAHRDMAKKILTYLKKSKQSITEKYQTWLKVALAIANAFTYGIGKKIYLDFCRLDGPFHDEYKSECLLQYCYRKRKLEEVNFGSIVYLAQQKGFIVSQKKGG